MVRKKTPERGDSSDEDVIEVGGGRPHEVQVQTPRKPRNISKEPSTPTKGPPSNRHLLESPLVTPKLDKRKTRHARHTQSAAEGTRGRFVLDCANGTTERAAPLASKPKEVLNSNAEHIGEKDFKLRWASVEADEDEQLLRKFDLEALYGPSVGLSRSERWRRAASMGLKPPEEVMSVLERNSQQNSCIFDQRLYHAEASFFV